MSQEITYRQACESDAVEIAKLSVYIQEEFAFPDYSAELQARMRHLSSASSTSENMANGDIFIMAEFENQLIGVIHMRSYAEIIQLFVHKQWHRRGIASELWRKAKKSASKAGATGNFSLHSSGYAVEVYKKWGFKIVDERNKKHLTYMKYDA